jgi:hypothetical protein
MGKEVHMVCTYLLTHTALHQSRRTAPYLTAHYVAGCFTHIMLGCSLFASNHKHGTDIYL